MSRTQSVSFRLPPEAHARLLAAADERGVKPAVLVADVVRRWLDGLPDGAGPAFTPGAVGPAADESGLEAVVCRAAWAVVVALSPTLDEVAAAAVVTELVRPARAGWEGR